MPLSRGIRSSIIANPSAGARLCQSSSLSTVSNLPPRADNSTEMNNNTQSLPVETIAETPDIASTRSPRKQPIPPPSEPRQYRAIGLVRGWYKPADEQLTRGILLGEDGTEIDAVLLGRTISLIKNHLNLEESHLWVVYPRTRQQDEMLHVQITGVWEPELLHPETLETDEANEADRGQSHETNNGIVPVEDGYFSVRGEAIFYSQEEESIIIKISQIPRKESDKKKYFKLNLKGILAGGRVLGHFWDIHILRQGNALTIQEAHNLGEVFKRKKRFTKGKPYKKSYQPRNEVPRAPRTNIPKPVQKADRSTKQ